MGGDWKPLEIVAMAGVATLAVVSLGVLLAWYQLRSRQIELAPCTSDDQAARILAESLAKVTMPPAGIAEVMTIFADMDSANKRLLASAVVGLVVATDMVLRPTLSERVFATVRSFSARNRSSPSAGS